MMMLLLLPWAVVVVVVIAAPFVVIVMNWILSIGKLLEPISYFLLRFQPLGFRFLFMFVCLHDDDHDALLWH